MLNCSSNAERQLSPGLSVRYGSGRELPSSKLITLKLPLRFRFPGVALSHRVQTTLCRPWVPFFRWLVKPSKQSLVQKSLSGVYRIPKDTQWLLPSPESCWPKVAST